MRYLFDKIWFKEHQRVLLWLLNAPVIKIWFRWVLRIKENDCPLKEKITGLAPNNFSFKDFVFIKDGKPYIKRTTDFRSHNKYSKRLYFAFKYIWYAFHAWDIFIANRFAPNLNLGFDTLTVYPNPGTGTAPIDGILRRGGVNEAWSSLRGGAGTGAYPTGDNMGVNFACSNTTNQYAQLDRIICGFDTDGLTADADISAAVLSLYVSIKVKTNYAGSEITFAVVGATPASESNLATGDFALAIYGTDELITRVAYADFTLDEYKAMSLNAAGISYIEKEANTIFGFRSGYPDINNSAPTWQSLCDHGLYFHQSDYTGTAADPKLVITYTIQFDKVLTETISAVSAMTKSAGKNLTSSISIIPTYSKIFSAIKTLSEIIKALPLFSSAGTFIKEFSEIVSIIGNFFKLKTAILTDMITVSFEGIKNTGKSFIEIVRVFAQDTPLATINLASGWSQSEGYEDGVGNIPPLRPNIYLAQDICDLSPNIDAVYKKVGGVTTSHACGFPVNNFSINETCNNKLLIHTTAPTSITVYLSASIIFSLSRTITLVINVSSSLISLVARTFNQSINIISELSNDAGKLLGEAITLVDQLASSISKVFGEIIRVSWSRISTTLKSCIEAIIAGDVFERDIIKILKEIISVAWVKNTHRSFSYIERVIAGSTNIKLIGKLFTETLSGRDIWEFTKTQFVELTDVVSVVLTFANKGLKTFAEIIRISGSFIFNISKIFGEIISALSNFLGAKAYYFTETISVAGNLGSWVIGKVMAEFVRARIIFTEGRNWVMSEIVAIGGSVLASAQKVLTETINIIGALGNWVIGKILSQIVIGADTIRFRKTQFKTLIDHLSVVVKILNKAGKIFSDILSATDAMGNWVIGKVIVQPFVVIDNYIKEWTLSRAFSEVVIAVGNAYNQGGKIFGEAISATGQFILGTISKLLIEVVKVYDTTAKSLTKIFAESFNVIGNAYSQSIKVFTEIVSVVGAFILGTISKLLKEIINVVGSYEKAWTLSRAYSETISIIGSALNQGGKIFAEALNVVGTFVLGTISKLFIETIKILAPISFSMTRVFSETINVIGNLYNSTGRIFTEIAAVVNPTIAKLTGRIFTEIVVAGWDKIKLVLNGIQVGLWKKVARITNGVWRKISRNDN